MTNKKIYIAKIFYTKNHGEDKLLTTKQATTKKEAINLARQEIIKNGKEDLQDLIASDLDDFRDLQSNSSYFRAMDFDDMDFPRTDFYRECLGDFIDCEETDKNELATAYYDYTIKLFSKKIK